MILTCKKLKKRIISIIIRDFLKNYMISCSPSEWILTYSDGERPVFFLKELVKLLRDKKPQAEDIDSSV